MPALLYMRINRDELKRAKAVWEKGSAEYNPSFGERLKALRNFYVPAFMVVFGVIAMVAGVGTAFVRNFSSAEV